MPKDGGIIGISDHGGWAVLVTVARDGTLLDRRRVELVDDSLPALPHHHEGQGLPVDEAVALVERVRASAERHAVLALDAVTLAVPRILGVALRNSATASAYNSRTAQGLPFAERCRLGDVPPGPGVRGRGARLSGLLVRREESI